MKVFHSNSVKMEWSPHLSLTGGEIKMEMLRNVLSDMQGITMSMGL